MDCKKGQFQLPCNLFEAFPQIENVDNAVLQETTKKDSIEDVQKLA